MSTLACVIVTAFVLLAYGVAAQQAPPQTDSSSIDSDGTAHVTRVVPVPKTISKEAQRLLARPASDAPRTETLAERRAGTDRWQAHAGEEMRKIYPASVEERIMAGVHTRVVTPPLITESRRQCVLINLHGGGFNSDSGSLTETIPIAHLTKTKVVAVLYRLAPEHPFPAAVDDTVAVYQELLKTYRPEHIGLYGTSAGAVLTAEVAARLRQLGIFSGFGDFSQPGDSRAIYALNGFSGRSPPLRKHRVPTSPTLVPPLSKIRFSRPCLPISPAPRRRFSSPALETCCSAEPRSFTGHSCAPESMHNSLCSRLSPTLSGTTRTYRSPGRHTRLWPGSSAAHRPLDEARNKKRNSADLAAFSVSVVRESLDRHLGSPGS